MLILPNKETWVVDNLFERMKMDMLWIMALGEVSVFDGPSLLNGFNYG